MATTTNYSFPTPDDTDLVKDGASAIRSFGTAVDTQIKDLSPGTTAGDIDYYTTSTAKARIAIGTTGQILTVAGGVPSWATAASSIPANETATVATSEVTSSLTYTNLTTAGPAVTLTTGTKALVIVTASIKAQTAGTIAYMSYAVSGATTIAASDAVALQKMQNTSTQNDSIRASAASVATLTAGSNTFTSKYRGNDVGNNNTFADRAIFVINLA